MHILIVGMTESGKSTLAKLLVRNLKSAGHKVAVLDPISDPAWKADFITSDIDEMRKYLAENRSVYVFIDESGSVFGEGRDATHSWLATTSRHYGHSVAFISQRAMQIPRTMRDQCQRLYLFTSSVADGELHAEEWNKPVLYQCNTLPQFYFYSVSR